MGSLYGLLAADAEADDLPPPKEEHCTCSHHHHHHHHSDDNDSCRSSYPGITRSAHRASNDSAGGIIDLRRPTDASSVSPTRRGTRTTSQDPSSEHHEHFQRHDTVDSTNTARIGSSRLNVAKAFERVGEIFGTPAPDRFDDQVFRTGKAAEYPRTPAEELRNRELSVIQDKYNATSRAGSFIGVEPSGSGQRTEGPHQSSSDLYKTDTWAGPSRRQSDRSASPAPRRATLEPPKQAYPGSFGSPSPRVATTFEPFHPDSPDDREALPRSPTIVVSTASDQVES